MIFVRAPLDGWLVYLAQGWRFCHRAELWPDCYGAHCVLLWRPE